MSLPVGPEAVNRFEAQGFDEHIAEIGQRCLYVPVRRCPCTDNKVTWDPDPDHLLCNGTGYEPFSFSELDELEYLQNGVKDGVLGEFLHHTMGLELLTPDRIQIDGFNWIDGVKTPKTFIYLTDFELVSQDGDDRGPIHISWIGDEPDTNSCYDIIYTVARESVVALTNNDFRAKLSSFEAGLWQEGDIKVTPPARERLYTVIPWEWTQAPIYLMGEHDRLILWDSRHPQTEVLEVPQDSILNLKWQWVIEVLRLFKLNVGGDGFTEITPTAIDQPEGTVTIPGGDEGATVTIRYTHRPQYHAYHVQPMNRAHERGKALPKYLLMRPVDAIVRDDKMTVDVL